MTKIALAPLVALALVFTLQCYPAAGFNIYDDYLTMPEPDELENDVFHQDVRIAINRIQIDDKSSVEEIKTQLNRLGDDHFDQSEIYHTLSDLNFGSSYPKRLIDVLKSILAQIKIKQKDGSDHEFVNIAHKLLHIYVKPLLKPETIYKKYHRMVAFFRRKEFDELYEAALDLNNWTELDSNLKKFDLAHDNFNARKMLDTARRIVAQKEFDDNLYESRNVVFLWPPYHVDRWRLKRANKPHPKAKSLEPLESFMKYRCRSDFLNNMDISNLAAIIYGREQLGTDIENELNEYNRMCQAWFNPKKHEEIENNIKNLLAVDAATI